MNKFAKVFALLWRPSLWPACVSGSVAGMEHLATLKKLNVNTFIDVGANKGQFSLLCQNLFPSAKIVAFEPMHDCADRCEKVLKGSDAQIFRMALGVETCSARFYVTERRDSSSLYSPGTKQFACYGTKLEQLQNVEVRRLDEVINRDQIVPPALIKIDVQGGELDVLRGASGILDLLDYVYLEGSFVELYDNQALITDLVLLLAANGFVLRDIRNMSYTKEFGATQADFLFSKCATED